MTVRRRPRVSVPEQVVMEWSPGAAASAEPAEPAESEQGARAARRRCFGMGWRRASSTWCGKARSRCAAPTRATSARCVATRVAVRALRRARLAIKRNVRGLHARPPTCCAGGANATTVRFVVIRAAVSASHRARLAPNRSARSPGRSSPLRARPAPAGAHPWGNDFRTAATR
jgi:hypothetical protein